MEVKKQTMAKNDIMDRGVGVVFGVIIAVIVYDVVQNQDFGSGIVNTIMQYVAPLFALGIVAKATDTSA